MTLAEQTLAKRTFKTMQLAQGFQVYCYKCNLIMPPGTLVHRYDAATYTHENCPNIPFKTYAPHRYGNAK